MDNGINSISEGQHKQRKRSIHSLENNKDFCVAQVLVAFEENEILKKVNDLSKLPPGAGAKTQYLGFSENQNFRASWAFERL